MAIAGALHGLRTRAGFNVEIRLEGDWVRFNDILNRFGPATMLISRNAQKHFAEKYKKRVKYHIRTGGKRFGYPGHSARYSRLKRRRGGGGRVLYWSGSMHDSVDVLKLPRGRVGVGIPSGVKRGRYPGEKDVNLTISEYANILEHGTFGGLQIPKRPVFADTFKQDMGGMKGLKSFMTVEIALGLKAQGINVTRL